MASRISGRKPDRLKFHWQESLFNAGTQLILIAYLRGFVISMLCLFLDLTAVLWAPQNWIYSLQWIIGTSVQAIYVDENPLVQDPKPPCLSYTEKKSAVQADAIDVSGWYGPGAYLAWLFTVYVASLSSIWHADYSNPKDPARAHETPDDGTIDGEFLAALTYPAIAILDILYRFITCKVDPTLDAALLVVMAGTFILGVARRLASPPDLDAWLGGQLFPSGPRQWTLAAFLVVGHTLIFETIPEPYHNFALSITSYALALANIIHSAIKVERLMDRYPYRVDEKRPRLERLAVFVVMQVIFLAVVGATQGSIFPRTGASLTDLDQCATLITVVVATLFTRRTALLAWLQQARTRLAGFRPVQSNAILG